MAHPQADRFALAEQPPANIVLQPHPGPQTHFLASPAFLILYGGGGGGGKAARLDEPVPTPTGWTTQGDLEVGDLVFDEHGQPTRVTQLHPVEPMPDAYRIVFQDGASIEVSGEHLWLTFTSKDRVALGRRTPESRRKRRASRGGRQRRVRGPGDHKNTGAFRPDLADRNRRQAADREGKGKLLPPPAGGVRSTLELSESVLDRSGSPNHSISVAGSLMLEESNLPIEPYTLGAWLGDGVCRSGAVTTADEEILNAIEAEGYTTRLRPSSLKTTKDGRKLGTYCVPGLTTTLRRAKILGNKHIPPEYMRASHRQRLELLRGLMDTDGYADATGRTEFTTTSPDIRDGMRELIPTLGLRWSECEGRAMLEGRDYGPKYRFRIYGPPGGDNIFRLERKAERYANRKAGTPSAARTRWRYIVSVEPCEPTPMRCITVENPSGLYQIGRSHIVTHNSWALIYAAILHGATTPGWTGLICRNKAVDLDKPGGLWDTAQELAALTGGHCRGGSPKDITWPGGGRLVFDYIAKGNYKNYKGAEIAFLGVDEANECPIEAIVFLMSRLRTTCGAEPCARLTCNPDPDHELAQWVDPHYLIDGGELDGCPDREQAGRIRYFARRASDDRFVFGDTPEEAAALAEREVEFAKSFTFIDALLDDNPSLAGDPAKRQAYLANLALQGAVVEDQLVRGNWRAKPGTVGMLRLELWGGGEWMLEPVAPIVKRVRAWDLASTRPKPGNKNPDFTVGVRMCWDAYGRWYIDDVVLCREEVGEVDELLAETASADGPGVTQVLETEGGSSGKRDTKTTREVLKSGGNCGPVVDVRAVKSKRAKARPMANELRLGMVGSRPRTHGEDKGPRAPRGFLLNATGWMTRVYEDAGNALPTVGAIVKKQIKRFIDPQVHDDVPDGASIAHNHGSPKKKKKSVGSRWDRLS